MQMGHPTPKKTVDGVLACGLKIGLGAGLSNWRVPYRESWDEKRRAT